MVENKINKSKLPFKLNKSTPANFGVYKFLIKYPPQMPLSDELKDRFIIEIAQTKLCLPQVFSICGYSLDFPVLLLMLYILFFHAEVLFAYCKPHVCAK